MTARRSRRERGAAAVEFALLLPVLFLIIAAIIDFGRFFYTQNVTVNAAREGARMLALGYPVVAAPATPPAPSASLRVSQAMINVPTYTPTFSYVASSGATVTGTSAACPTTGALPGDHVRVTVKATNFSFLVLGPAFSLLGGSISQPVPSGTADVRCGG